MISIFSEKEYVNVIKRNNAIITFLANFIETILYRSPSLLGSACCHNICLYLKLKNQNIKNNNTHQMAMKLVIRNLHD